MTSDTHHTLANHLLRDDGDEDICMVTYTTSTGANRTTRILHTVELPQPGERRVHGNATITGEYVVRVAAAAMLRGHGVAILHSHPFGRGWQRLSRPDHAAEAGYADLVQQVTGLPLLGLTLAGDSSWSARQWDTPDEPTLAESLRVVGTGLNVTFNPDQVPAPALQRAQTRTIAAWGDPLHRNIIRLRVLVIGVGSVGLDIAQRLAATGIQYPGVMDFDHITVENLDRMVGATRKDAREQRRKIDVAKRLMKRAATTPGTKVARHNLNITTPEGLAAALDYDLIFSCVDRPWARTVLNTLAYADLIPVIDGGTHIDRHDDGTMMGATRRTQTATPGRPCMLCSGQLNATEIRLDMDGLLDDAEYLKRSGREPLSGSPNVAALCAAVSGSQLEHLVSLIAQPSGLGVPLPLRFALAAHGLERVDVPNRSHCPTENYTAAGDQRTNFTRPPKGAA